MRYSRIAALLAGLFVVLPALADYLAYSVGERGRSPLPEFVVDVESRYLLNVEWGDYRGNKVPLTVMPVTNNSTAGSNFMAAMGSNPDFMSDTASVPVDGIQLILKHALESSGRFALVRPERPSFMPPSAQSADAPPAQKAEFMLQTVLTDYRINAEEKEGKKGKIRGKVPFLGGPKGATWVGLDLRLIETATNNIAFSKEIEGIIRKDDVEFSSQGLGGDQQTEQFLSTYSATPIGQAVFAAIHEGVYELIRHLGNRPPEGVIVKVESSQIYTNMGDDMVAMGDLLHIVRGGEELFDPRTGNSLGGSVVPVGVIEVTLVQDKFSVARAVSMNGTPNRGDRIISTKEPEPLEFPKKWKKPK